MEYSGKTSLTRISRISETMPNKWRQFKFAYLFRAIETAINWCHPWQKCGSVSEQSVVTMNRQRLVTVLAITLVVLLVICEIGEAPPPPGNCLVTFSIHFDLKSRLSNPDKGKRGKGSRRRREATDGQSKSTDQPAGSDDGKDHTKCDKQHWLHCRLHCHSFELF